MLDSQFSRSLLRTRRRCKKDHGRAEALLLAAWSVLYLQEHKDRREEAGVPRAAQRISDNGTQARKSRGAATARGARQLEASQHAWLVRLQADAAQSGAPPSARGTLAAAMPEHAPHEAHAAQQPRTVARL
jgi:hypothetical protein